MKAFKYSQQLFLLSLCIIAITTVSSFEENEGIPTHQQDFPNSRNDSAAFDELLREESIEETVRNVLLQMRNQSDLKIPGVEIADPMEIPDFNTTIDQGATKADVMLWNITVGGLSSFYLDEVSADLEDMNMTIGLNISTLLTKGQYNLKGKTYFLRLLGGGDFWMKVVGAYVPGSVKLMVNEEGLLEVESIHLDFNVRDIQLHFDKLFGGGAASTFTNTLLNALSRIIFESIKPSILDQLETTMKTVLDQQLHTLPPQPVVSKSRSPLDLAIANAATQLREKGYDPLSAPSFQQRFNRRILFMTFRGNITLFKGYVKGLSTLHRTGPIKMAFKENSLTATAELGFNNLEGGYNWDATLMKVSRKGDVHFLVKGLSLMMTATQENELNSHPQLQELKITKLEKIALDMDGLGSFDFLLEFFTNFFTNIFKKQFARITETQLKKTLQENLNQIQLPF